jgi:hypothetical protein
MAAHWTTFLKSVQVSTAAIGTDKKKLKSDEKHEQILQTNILKEIAYRKKVDHRSFPLPPTHHNHKL